MKTFNRKSLCALLMVLSLLLGMCFTACGEKDPVKYAQNLEREAVKELAGELADAYDEYLSMGNEETSVEYALDIDISPAALSLITSALGATDMEIDLSFLSNISLDGELYSEGSDVGSLSMAFALGDNPLIGLDLLADMEAGEVIIGVPDLLKKYVSINIGDLLAEMDATALPSFDVSKLPKGETLEKLINKYADIVFDGIKTVEREEETVKANGVEAKLDVLEITVTEEDAMEVAKALLTEAKGDKDLESVIVAFVDTVASYSDQLGEEIPSGAELYADLSEQIDMLLADLASEAVDTDAVDADEAAAADDEEQVLVIKSYVDDDEIVGRVLSMGDEEFFSYIYAEDKDDFGFELTVYGEEYMRGEGTNDGKELNGTFELLSEGEVMLAIDIEDLDVKALEEDGYINGTVEIALDSLEGAIGDGTVSALLGGYSVRIELAQKDDKNASFAIGLVDEENTSFVEISMEVSEGNGKGVERPADDAIIEIPTDMDEDALAQLGAELLESIDADAIKARIDALPIPEEYAALIDGYLGMLGQ